VAPLSATSFNDGHIDVVLNNVDSVPTLLRNVVSNFEPLGDV
jgi:hypothetical protein